MWEFIAGFLVGIPVLIVSIFALGVVVSRNPEMSGKIMARVVKQLMAGKGK